jgi:hypothetical protein
LSLMLALFGVPAVLVGLLGRSSFAYGLVLVIVGGIGIVAGVCCGLLWLVSHDAESASVFCGSVGVSAPRYRSLENVRYNGCIIADTQPGDSSLIRVLPELHGNLCGALARSERA